MRQHSGTLIVAPRSKSPYRQQVDGLNARVGPGAYDISSTIEKPRSTQRLGKAPRAMMLSSKVEVMYMKPRKMRNNRSIMDGLSHQMSGSAERKGSAG